ncbi:MAG: NAD(P)/FAD-dependent oxidoreductase [Flavobacterium sp.]|nr:MAG: NAD(P)/FAD-dependent oxidoreductase [Flavobacterium sp.]
MSSKSDVLIIGGGLAGLTAAIHLSKSGLAVTVIEKSSYPRHKVCGEYISNEILPYLDWIGVDVSQLNPVTINKFEFSSVSGATAKSDLPLGGFGVSRYVLDDYLYKKAVSVGCDVICANVTHIQFANDSFTILTADEEYKARIVIGAYGKRSNVDKVLSRKFISKNAPWLAVKAHYRGNFADDTVALHNFDGGYCGASKVEDGNINICYLADYATFRKYKNIEDYQENELYKNGHLRQLFENSSMVFDKPLTISQISFDRKQPVENHILMTGDTAGLIHPLCGNGMAMAIHSAKIASESILDYFSGKIDSREKLEQEYTKQWKAAFSRRLFMGRVLGKVLRNKSLTNVMMHTAVRLPGVLPALIKQTHGKPIMIKNEWV